MPDWVENLLIIESVSQERLEVIRKEIVGNETRIAEDGTLLLMKREIDFQKILPVPTDSDLNISRENMRDWKFENWGTIWNSLNNRAISPDSIFFFDIMESIFGYYRKTWVQVS